MEKIGFNFFCQPFGDMGIPNHTREIIEASLKRGWDTKTIPLGFGFNPKIESCVKQTLGTANGLEPALVFWYPNVYDEVLGVYPKNTALFVFEYTKIPAHFLEQIDKLDTIYTPSDWGVNILRENGVTIDIKKFPGGVNPCKFNILGRKVWNKTDKFKFLHVGKAENRKGTELLIRSFVETFHNNKNVELVLSIDNPHIRDFNADTYVKRITDAKNIKTIHFVKDIKELYHSHHCAVFPTMAEAIGLPIVEAIACGIPTIATRNSGTSEYLDLVNCQKLTKLREVPVYDPVFFPKSGEFGIWESPTQEELSEKMFYVYNNYSKVLETATNDSKILLEKYTWDKALDYLNLWS